MRRRWKYRKVSPEVLERMKQLREQGLSYGEVAKKVGVSCFTVVYHLRPEVKERRMQEAMKRYIERVKSLSQKDLAKMGNRRKHMRKYMRDYMRTRYQQDAEFRERLKAHMKRRKAYMH